ncbi:MAG: hypothetical protein JNJ71_16135 [Rubrivivax sp.]|nr:hypothetical protein [Rubrivivax sp.]
MALLRKRRFDELDPFSDLLFNTLLAFVMLFAIAMIAMNPKAKTGVIDAKAEFIITVTWPDLNPNDIDTWVQDPGGNLVWFRSREAGMMHLDRDDRGLSNDTIVINGQKVVNPLNQEVVTIRGFAPGEYTVNVHYYETQNGEPVTVNVSVVKVNPRAEVVYYGSVTVQRKGDEATAARFSVDPQGGVSGVNTLAKTLVERI